MKIRLRHDLGVCEGYLSAKAGDIIEVAESSAVRYIRLGYAEAVSKATVEVPVETAVAQQKNVETATADVPATPPADVPKPLDEGDDSSKDEISKSRPPAAAGRKR